MWDLVTGHSQTEDGFVDAVHILSIVKCIHQEVKPPGLITQNSLRQTGSISRQTLFDNVSRLIDVSLAITLIG